MDRMIQKNVIALSGRAIEAAGDVNVLLLDKTGTITLGNRQATQFVPVRQLYRTDLAGRAQMASLTDETPEAAASWSWPSRNTVLRADELPTPSLTSPSPPIRGCAA